MTKPDDVRYVYTPQEGRFVIGIPARDLTQADVDRLGDARMAHAVATGLYAKAKKGAASEPAKQPTAEKGSGA